MSSFSSSSHEEVGSISATGAASSIFRDVISNLLWATDIPQHLLMQVLNNSYMVSLDVAFAVHPNHPELFDNTNRIHFGEGVAIKMASNQRYATNAQSIARCIQLCENAGVKYQMQMANNEIPLGNTLTSITAIATPMPSVDLGVATWSTHSARETSSMRDTYELYKLLDAFLNQN